MRAEEITTVEQYVEELKKGLNKVYINEWGTQMAGPKWPRPVFAFNTQVTRDAIKHFVDGIGDLNPIFRDREYAKKTKYGCLISPPTFLYTIGYGQYPDPPGFPPLKNFNNPYAGDEYEWFRPVCEVAARPHFYTGGMNTVIIVMASRLPLAGFVLPLSKHGDVLSRVDSRPSRYIRRSTLEKSMPPRTVNMSAGLTRVVGKMSLLASN
jgi:hypothetical protein